MKVILTKMLDQTVELSSLSLGFTDGGWLGEDSRGQGRVVADHWDLCNVNIV